MRHALSRRSGFTLVELLTVIAIIAILLALFFPAFTSAIGYVQRLEAANKLRQIHLAYYGYATEGGQTRTILFDSGYDFARDLAQFANLNNAELFSLGDDPAVSGALASGSTRPTIVATQPSAGGADWPLDPNFSGFPLSFTFVSGLNAGSRQETTPLAWTRGLTAAGTWTSDSPYEGEGGHILFLDGHVVFYRQLTLDNTPFRTSTGQPTINFNDAVGSAVVHEWAP